jgi:hypothetical protein
MADFDLVQNPFLKFNPWILALALWMQDDNSGLDQLFQGFALKLTRYATFFRQLICHLRGFPFFRVL